MVGRIKLFQFTQTVYQDMGICPSPSNQNHRSINWRNFSMLISLIQMFICSLLFLIIRAETITDAGISFYAANTEFFCAIFVVVNFHKMPNILKLIQKYEKFIENSECIHFYSLLKVLKF